MVTTSSTLLVDNVQGSFNIGVGTVLFNNGSAILSIDGKTGIGTTVDGQIGSAATVSSFEVDPIFDGLHFKVNHRSGMHNASNRVSIKGILPDTPITTLTADYTQSSLEIYQLLTRQVLKLLKELESEQLIMDMQLLMIMNL